jgi:hypothetical protein
MKSRPLRISSIWLLASLIACAQPPVLNVNQQRLWATLEKLSEFGRPAGGGFNAGVNGSWQVSHNTG